MTRYFVSLALAAAFLAGVGQARAEPTTAPSSFTPAQREEMKKLVHDYIVQNPEVITEAVAALQAKEDKDREAKQKALVQSHTKELRDLAEGTVIGNPKGDITLVEFFDYNCGYCKGMFPELLDAIKKDGRVRVVLKEFPILGPSSVTASKAALASVKQGKYADFHIALMSHKGSLSDDTIMKIAKDTGLDVDRLQTDMKADDISKVIAKNEDLARTLEVNGTPAMLIGETFVPGAIKEDQIKEYITKARAKS